MENMEGDESTSNYFFQKNLLHHNMKVWMNHNKMDEKKSPKHNVRSGLVISGWLSKRLNEPP
jgi:hypothetical protein